MTQTPLKFSVIWSNSITPNHHWKVLNRADFQTIPCSYEILSQSDIAMYQSQSQHNFSISAMRRRKVCKAGPSLHQYQELPSAAAALVICHRSVLVSEWEPAGSAKLMTIIIVANPSCSYLFYMLKLSSQYGKCNVWKVICFGEEKTHWLVFKHEVLSTPLPENGVGLRIPRTSSGATSLLTLATDQTPRLLGALVKNTTQRPGEPSTT